MSAAAQPVHDNFLELLAVVSNHDGEWFGRKRFFGRLLGRWKHFEGAEIGGMPKTFSRYGDRVQCKRFHLESYRVAWCLTPLPCGTGKSFSWRTAKACVIFLLMLPAPLKISPEIARRFMRRALLLDAPVATVGAALAHHGFIQIDPINI